MDLILHFFLRSSIICGIIITICHFNLPDPTTIRLYGYAPDGGARALCFLAWFAYMVVCLTECAVSVVMAIVATAVIIAVANRIRSWRYK
jgi:hypothetical protein